MFNPFHPLLIPPQPCIPTFFGNYSSSFQVASNQSAKTDLEKNDLQVGIGTVSNTASSVEFSSMVHSMGLAHITFAPTSVVAARLFNSNGTKLRDVGTATVYANENFTPSTYSPSSHNFLRVSKPGNISFTPSSSTFTWNKNSATLTANTATTLTVSCSKEYEYKGTPTNYDYTGTEQTFTAPANAEYLLEVWGAQGGGTSSTPGGKGGYSYCLFSISSSQTFYVYVGGCGKTYSSFLLTNITDGGYNGGGGVKYNVGKDATDDGHFWNATGGGASHIATASGLLNTLISQTSNVILVAGGGGGAAEWHEGNFRQYASGGAGGGLNGITGNNTDHIPGTGGTQSSGGTTGGIFGHGGVVSTCMQGSSGGGGGWYGGGGAQDNAGGGGGSGYIKSGLNGETIAGNTSFASPSGGTETGHSGNGYAVITQLSY